ncbi:PAS domain-containing protein [Streptomyces fradiae]|uniref:PAS domain-containing protein n=1 Tax=Streptomyces fradiae TaxID=1906 RepID=UPI0036F54050
MSETGSFGEDLADFVRRVGALRGSRALPAAELRGVLDAALFELEHAAETLWPRYERLAARAPEGTSAERRERQLLRAVFQRLPLPVVLVDRDTAVRRMNPAATALTGVRAGYATGRPLAGLLAPGDRAPFRSQVAAAARGEGARSLTVRLLQRPDEPVRATLTALSPPGEPQRTVVLVLQPGVPGAGAVAGAGAGTGTGSGAVPGVARPGGGRAPSAAGAGTAAGAGAASGAPGRPGGAPERPGGVPGLAEATERAGALDLVDAVATALLRTAPGDARGALEAAARVLHGRFADWVVADLCPEGPDGPLRRAAVLGRRTATPGRRGRWPRRIPPPARSWWRWRRAGPRPSRCAPRTRWRSGRTPTGRRCWCAPGSVRCCACRWWPRAPPRTVAPPVRRGPGCWGC